jgi:microcystin-dependent protein
MAKTKISEFSATSADNTDITNINIAEGCSPANVNNAIRSLMSLLKNQQDGSSGDPFTVAGTLVSSGQVDITGAFRLDGTAGASGQVLLSAGGSNTPTWGNAFVAGMIMLWSGSSASIPSGWLLCDGSSSTPDLRNRFVVGAGSTYAVGATGGSTDAIVVSHNHTATTSISDPGHIHNVTILATTQGGSGGYSGNFSNPVNVQTLSATTGISASTSISTAGSSGTNANLPPYYALCYIMKA